MDTRTTEQGTAPAGAEGGAAITATKKRPWLGRSLIGRHWRGDYGLARSLLLHGLLTDIIAIPLMAPLWTAAGDYPTVNDFIAQLTRWSVVATLFIWHIGGAWRSAGRRPGGWARLVKALCVLLAFGVIADISRVALPELWEDWSILTGDLAIPAYELHLLRGGTELEFAGGVKFGAARDLERRLDAAPQVHLIHFDSDGGWIEEAKRIRDLIRRRGLDTYVSNHCVSACTIAYLGGIHRYLQYGAMLGFHGGTAPGATVRQTTANNQQIVREMIQFGVDERFAQHAFTVSPDSMWYPEPGELIRAGVVTRMAWDEFAISGLGRHPTRQQIEERFFGTLPLYQTMKAAAPREYQEILSMVQESTETGRALSDVEKKRQEITRKAVRSRLPTSSDEAVLLITQASIDALTSINRVSSLICAQYAENGDSLLFARYFTPQQMQQAAQAKEAVLKGAGSGQSEVLTDAEAAPLYDLLNRSIAARYPPRIAQGITDIRHQPKEEVCGLLITLYREAMALPPPQNTRLLRKILLPH